MENANKDKVNLINGKSNGDRKEGLQWFKDLLKKIKAYKGDQNKPKKILIATDADACLFCGNVSTCAGTMEMGVMSDMVYVYRNIFKLCEEAGIKCDFCFLTKLQPYQCNPFFKEQLSERLGKGKDEKPFIKPEDIKFAPYDGKNDDIDHDSFNKKMFNEEGYKDTEVLYFDNDLGSHKINNFNDNLESKTQEVGATAFPVNIVHTEDVKNWITEEKVREDIVEKNLEQVWDLDKDIQKQWERYGGKPEFIKTNKQCLQLEQKTYNGNFNEDGLRVADLLTATQGVLFDAKSELKDKQNVWIKQNYETDTALANKLFNKYYKETNLLYDRTMDKMKQDGGIFEDVFYEVAKDTFKKIEDDEEIKDILNKYSPEPQLDTSVNEKSANKRQQDANKENKEKEMRISVDSAKVSSAGAQTSEFSWWNPCTWFNCCKDVQNCLDTDRGVEMNLQ